jgi:hypothetical protein
MCNIWVKTNCDIQILSAQTGGHEDLLEIVMERSICYVGGLWLI